MTRERRLAKELRRAERIALRILREEHLWEGSAREAVTLAHIVRRLAGMLEEARDEAVRRDGDPGGV